VWLVGSRRRASLPLYACWFSIINAFIRCTFRRRRFGKTQFFEYPITNPFAHEERFQIEINDPELRLVTAFDEWLHLRRACR
jgi:hypothetical protein